MPGPDTTRVTVILRHLQDGQVDHEEATRELFVLIYDELRRIAGRLMNLERAGSTLQATALVNEAYLRLADAESLVWQNRAHFFGVAARAMRQILVDHARNRKAAKRGGDWRRVTLHEAIAEQQEHDFQVLELEDALVKLADEHERMARIAELRLFGGLRMTEIAHVLQISRRTAQDDWRVARMWLRRELYGDASPAGDKSAP